MPNSIRLAGLVTICVGFSTPVAAQSPSDVVAGARLGSGYAQILNIAGAPDISAANYRVQDDETPASIKVLRLPYEARMRPLSPDTDLYWKVVGGYVDMEADLPVMGNAGTISSKWTAYSLTGGLLAKIRMSGGFTLKPGLDVGVARLDNHADYAGIATILQPSLDGLLFNWHTNASLVTPNLGLDWERETSASRTSIRGHLAWSWISSFDESSPVLKFNETAGVYSIRAEHAMPTGVQLANRSLDWLLLAGFAGFFGSNRDALGFKQVSELGLGIEAPVSTTSTNAGFVRLTAGYLFGPDVRGWTVSLGLRN